MINDYHPFEVKAFVSVIDLTEIRKPDLTYQPEIVTPLRRNRTSSVLNHPRTSIMNNLDSTLKSQRIYFSNGCWWLSHAGRDRSLRLDSRFAPCGWNVGRLCQNLGIGNRTFSRMVKEGLGVSPKRWLREIRINVACHLLREDCKIEVVAQTLGFMHASDFTREFKKMAGVSPSRYVKAEYSRSTECYFSF